MVIMQYGGLLAVRNRRVSILQSNPLWGPRRNLVVPMGMIGTVLIAVTNLYGPGLRKVFATAPIPGMFWGLPFTFALGILTVDEMRKLIVRTYPKASIFRTCPDLQCNTGCSLSSPRWLGSTSHPFGQCWESMKIRRAAFFCVPSTSVLQYLCEYDAKRLANGAPRMEKMLRPPNLGHSTCAESDEVICLSPF
jgi:hypothetical protein